MPAPQPDQPETLGQRIVKARESQELSTAQLARRMAINTATLSGWETGRAEPRANRLVVLAAMTNVSLSWLLTGRGPGPAEYSLEAEFRQLHANLTALHGQAQALTDQLADAIARLDTMQSEITARDEQD